VHYLLRQYKDGPAQLRRRLMPRVAALLARFLQQHGQCIGGWDLITVVPSSIGRPGQHPLAQAINMVPALADTYRALLHAGLHPAGHLAARDDAFVVTREATGRRVLLVDDTFTTGAEIQRAVQHRLHRLHSGRQALERGQQGVAQAALDSDLVVSTSKGHRRLLLPCPAAVGRSDALALPSSGRSIMAPAR
jgi:hypothetical protein